MTLLKTLNPEALVEKAREAHSRVEVRMHTDGKLHFFVGMGWAGFNLPKNNGQGYDTAEKALAASNRSERRGKERRAIRELETELENRRLDTFAGPRLYRH
jgi:hypothetical protein